MDGGARCDDQVAQADAAAERGAVAADAPLPRSVLAPALRRTPRPRLSAGVLLVRAAERGILDFGLFPMVIRDGLAAHGSAPRLAGGPRRSAGHHPSHRWPEASFDCRQVRCVAPDQYLLLDDWPSFFCSADSCMVGLC